MRKVAIAAVMMCAGTASADVCETWHGTSISDAKVSTAGTSALTVMRTTEPDVLTAMTLGESRTTHELSVHAGTFELVSSPASHLLVASDGVQGAIVAQRLSTKGEEIGAPITLMPAAMRDQHIETALFDDRDFIVIVHIGGVTSDEMQIVVVATDGTIRKGPDPLVIAHDSRVFPGPVPGTLWVVEHLNDAARGHLRAFVHGADGPVIDLGVRVLTDAATSASGELLVLHHASDDTDVVASIVAPDGRVTTIPTGVRGFWSPTARPDGSYLLVHGADDVIEGFVLDAAGAPLGAPALWTRGKLRGVTQGHIVWTQTIESPEVRTHQLVTMPISANGATGAALPLASHRQDREEYECGTYGCSDAGGGGAGMLVLLLVLMYVSRDVRARRQLRGAS